MTTTKPPQSGSRLSFSLLVLIVLAVGTMAGLASFTHVHDWTMDNSPTGTHSWFGWANAVITELVPTAALIVIAQRRRTGGSITYPMTLLIAALALSLTAQLAVAVPTVFGWIVSAIPSVFFFALSKLVFSATGHHPAPAEPATQPRPATSARATTATRITHVDTPPTLVPAPAPAPSLASSSSDPATVQALPQADTRTPAPQIPSTDARTSGTVTPTPKAPAPAVVPLLDPVRIGAADPAATPAATLADLLPGARRFAKSHTDTHGTSITANQLAVRMRLDSNTAEQLLHQLQEASTSNTAPHNGHTVAGVLA